MSFFNMKLLDESSTSVFVNVAGDQNARQAGMRIIFAASTSRAVTLSYGRLEALRELSRFWQACSRHRRASTMSDVGDARVAVIALGSRRRQPMAVAPARHACLRRVERPASRRIFAGIAAGALPLLCVTNAGNLAFRRHGNAATSNTSRDSRHIEQAIRARTRIDGSIHCRSSIVVMALGAGKGEVGGFATSAKMRPQYLAVLSASTMRNLRRSMGIFRGTLGMR